MRAAKGFITIDGEFYESETTARLHEAGLVLAQRQSECLEGLNLTELHKWMKYYPQDVMNFCRLSIKQYEELHETDEPAIDTIVVKESNGTDTLNPSS